MNGRSPLGATLIRQDPCDASLHHSIPFGSQSERSRPPNWRWRRSALNGLALGLLFLAGCGGSSHSSSVPDIVLDVALVGCNSTEVHDTGEIVYLLVARSCNLVFPVAAQFRMRTEERSTTAVVNFSGFAQEQRVSQGLSRPRTVSLHRRGTWRSFENQASWGWRDGAGLLVKGGQMYLLGGYRAGEGNQNEVWRSSNARDWELLIDEAPWYGRHGAAWVVHQDRLFVISGDLNDDVWSSQDGIDWRVEKLGAPFGKRYTPNAISDGKNIVLYAGQYWEPYDWCAFAPECKAVGFNDVWSSETGASWSLLNPSAPWPGRGLIHGAVRFKERIYLIGGGLKMGLVGTRLAETVAEYNDIWSSADGIDWRQEATELGFPARTHFSVAAAPQGCFVSDGSVGLQGTFSNDVFFASDCIHFAAIPDHPPMQRRHASSMAYFNGSLVILGGPPYAGPESTAGTEVWQYFPD